MAGASQDWISKDFYKVLGVSKDASQEQIKKAYRKLARKYHPDRNPGDTTAEKKFKEAGEAYSVLSNPDQRKQYDAIRALGGGGARFTAGGGGNNGGFDDIFSQMFGGGGAGRTTFRSGGAGFDDVFQMFTGRGGNQGGFGFQAQPQAQRGQDQHASVSLPLRQAVSGTTVKLNANGHSLTARVPAGVEDGQKIRVRGKGAPGANGGPNGDIIITVHVEKHPVYEMRGRGIYVNVPVSFGEAALGGDVDVPTLDGGSVRVRVPAGSSTDKLLRVRGHGVPAQRSGGKAGDLYVRLKVVVPRKMGRDATEAVRAFVAATAEADPRADFRRMAAS